MSENPKLFVADYDRVYAEDGRACVIPTFDTQITLRDLFAAFALMGDLSNSADGPLSHSVDSTTCEALRAFAFADAMLAEREKATS